MNGDRLTLSTWATGSPTPTVLDTPSVSPTFGEHHAQLRMVGAAFYIDDLTIPGERLSSAGRAINQPASNQVLLHQRTCSLTAVNEFFVAKHWKGFGESLQVHPPGDAQSPQSVEPVFDRVKKAARIGNVQIIERMGLRPDANGVVAQRACHVAQWVENGAQQPDVELPSSQLQELLTLGLAVHNPEAEELEDVAMQRQAPIVYAGVVVRDPE